MQTYPAKPTASPDRTRFLLVAIVLRAFPRPGQRWVFILVSAALYVLNHIYRLHKGPVEWGMLFCFGLAYGSVLWRTRTLWAAVGLHWAGTGAAVFQRRSPRDARIRVRPDAARLL